MQCLSAPHSHPISGAVLPPAPPWGDISPGSLHCPCFSLDPGHPGVPTWGLMRPCPCHPHAHVILCPHDNRTLGTRCQQAANLTPRPLQAGLGLAPQCGFWKGWSSNDHANYLFNNCFKWNIMILMWGGSILTLWDGKGGCLVQVCHTHPSGFHVLSPLHFSPVFVSWLTPSLLLMPGQNINIRNNYNTYWLCR